MYQRGSIYPFKGTMLLLSQSVLRLKLVLVTMFVSYVTEAGLGTTPLLLKTEALPTVPHIEIGDRSLFTRYLLGRG